MSDEDAVIYMYTPVVTSPDACNHANMVPMENRRYAVRWGCRECGSRFDVSDFLEHIEKRDDGNYERVCYAYGQRIVRGVIEPWRPLWDALQEDLRGPSVV